MRAIEYRHYFAGKKITLMGLGLLGRGIGDAKFLAEAGADLLVTDLKTETELASSLAALEDFKNITYHLGGHQLEDFHNRDLIIKASGVPLDSPYIAQARKNKIPVAMSVALFAKFFPGPIVGVTGTLGKTTTAHMINHVLRQAGLKTILAGNVPGGSTLALLPQLNSETIVVLELDSWTLQGFGEEKISPPIAVFTFFGPDHLNYYRGDMEQYFVDKANIFLFQKAGDTLICDEAVASLIKQKYGSRLQSKVLITKSADWPGSWPLRLPGKHNYQNAVLAWRVAQVLGVDEQVAKEALAGFSGVPGRLEFLGEKGGVKFYNDTAATTPLAAAAGLEAVAGDQQVIVIGGGSGKDLDPTPFAEALQKYAREIILLSGTGTEKLKACPLAQVASWKRRATDVQSLEEAVAKAVRLAKRGDIITLTPGFASFGLFKNMYDRGEQFNNLVKKLK